MKTIENILKTLDIAGCYPCISKRGTNLWRAHINSAGNWWDEGKTPREALNKAFASWVKNGKQMDGMAEEVINA